MKKKIKNFIIFLIVIFAMLCTSVLLKRHKICKELSRLENGYDSFTLSDEQKRFKDVQLFYIGTAKVDASKYEKVFDYGMTYRPYFDGEDLFTFEGYLIFVDEKQFNLYSSEKWFNLYDFEFEIVYEEGINYVMSFGRKLEWLQYNPNWISQFGTVANRVGFDWNAEIDPATVYVYAFKYNRKENGAVGNMTEEF